MVSSTARQQTIHLIRHAEALHNTQDDWTLPDPILTKLGLRQAKAMPQEYAELMASCDLIVASPLRRTIQTTLHGLEPVLCRKVPVILLAELQENGANPCDTGSPVATLRKEFGHHAFLDFSEIAEDWTSKRGIWSPSDAALARRARWVRQWLKARPERNIAVVTHGSFLRQLTHSPWSMRWNNAEDRVFRFVDDGPLQSGRIDTDEDDALLELVDLVQNGHRNGHTDGDEAPDDR